MWAAQGWPGVTRKAENLGWSRVSREERRLHSLCLQDILCLHSAAASSKPRPPEPSFEWELEQEAQRAKRPLRCVYLMERSTEKQRLRFLGNVLLRVEEKGPPVEKLSAAVTAMRWGCWSPLTHAAGLTGCVWSWRRTRAAQATGSCP